jgi:hypothetical protein
MEAPTETPATTAGSRQRNRNSWTLLLVLTAAMAVTSVILVAFRDRPTEQGSPAARDHGSPGAWTPAPDSQTAAVALEIDFGNGARREFAALRWSSGMTVADVMKLAASFRPGLSYSQQGSGAGAYLTSVDGVTAEASIGRFWIYEINGKSGKVSFAIQPLAAGDRVLWAFKQPE